MKLGKVLRVCYYMVDDFYYPLQFMVGGNEEEGKFLMPNEIYQQYEDIQYKNMLTVHGRFPVPFRGEVPLVDEVLPFNCRHINNAPDADTINTLSSYVNCLEGIEEVSYDTYMRRALMDEEEALEDYRLECEKSTPPNQEVETYEVKNEEAISKSAPIDLVSGSWMIEDEEAKGEQSLIVQEQERVEQALVVEKNVNEADCVLIETYSTEQINAITEQLNQYTDYDKQAPVAFIPRLRKHSEPYIKSLQGVSKDDFAKRIYLCAESIARTENEINFMQEIASVIPVEDSRLLDPVVYIRVFNSEEYYGILYEMLKYKRLDESPNGLYNNMYYTIYLLGMACKDLGYSQEDIEGMQSYILFLLCCDINQLNLIDVDNDKDDDDGLGDGVNLSTVSETNGADYDIYQGLNALCEMIYKCVSSGTLKFESYLKDVDTINLVQKLCISSKYNLRVYLESEIQKELHLDVLNFNLMEYGLSISFCGIPVSPACLGCTIYYNTITPTSDIMAAIENGEGEVITTRQYISYNSFLKQYKNSPDYCRITNLNKFKPIEDPRDLTLDLHKVVVLLYSKENPAKPPKEFYGLILNAIQEDGTSRYIFYPKASTVYDELSRLGVVINILDDKGNRTPVPFKTEIYATLDDGAYAYKFDPTIKAIITASKGINSNIYMARDIDRQDRKSLFSTLGGAISILKRPRQGTNERALLINLPAFIQNDIQRIEEVLAL